MSTKNIITPNFVTFCLELQDAFKEGFLIDFENNTPNAIFTYYEATLVRDDIKEELKAVFSEDPDKIDFSVVVNAGEEAKRGRKPKAV